MAGSAMGAQSGGVRSSSNVRGGKAPVRKGGATSTSAPSTHDDDMPDFDDDDDDDISRRYVSNNGAISRQSDGHAAAHESRSAHTGVHSHSLGKQPTQAHETVDFDRDEYVSSCAYRRRSGREGCVHVCLPYAVAFP